MGISYCMEGLTDRPVSVGITTNISSEADCLHILIVVCEGISLSESCEGISEKLTSHRHGNNNQCVLFSDVMLH